MDCPQHRSLSSCLLKKHCHPKSADESLEGIEPKCLSLSGCTQNLFSYHGRLCCWIGASTEKETVHPSLSLVIESSGPNKAVYCIWLAGNWDLAGSIRSVSKLTSRCFWVMSHSNLETTIQIPKYHPILASGWYGSSPLPLQGSMWLLRPRFPAHASPRLGLALTGGFRPSAVRNRGRSTTGP